MTPPTWHSGPPPHVGVFIASYNRSLDFKRWWDGHSWSKPSQVGEKAEYAVGLHDTRAAMQERIEWTE